MMSNGAAIHVDQGGLVHEAIAVCLDIINSKSGQSEAREKLLLLLDQILASQPESPSGISFTDPQDAHLSREPSFISPLGEEPSAALDSLGVLGRLAREAFNRVAPSTHRKRYGQFFTPATITALTCAAAIRSDSSSVIDPMCGTGAMLWAAHERFNYLHARGDVTGVEIDPLAARIAALPRSESDARGEGNTTVLHADAFLGTSGLTSHSGPDHHHGRYDAIVGNPPYVRYQNIASVLRGTSPTIVDAFQKQLYREPESVIAGTIIRASLIAHLLSEVDTSNPQRLARAAIDLLRSDGMQSGLDSVQTCWLRIVSNYSGLADLSLPAWLLTWLLARPNSIIAYVTTSSWKSRMYSRLLRYFMLRMLQPLLIIEQEGNTWFGDALIPTSLLVFRARTHAEVTIPLGDRARDDHAVRIVRIKREHNLADPTAFRNAAQVLSEQSLIHSATDLAACADEIIRSINGQEHNVETDLWSINMTSEESLINGLFHEDRVARHSRGTGISLQYLEGGREVAGQLRTSGGATVRQEIDLPQPLRQMLNITDIPREAFCLLKDYGVEVNQGLRTGCNPFFYVRQLGATDWAALFPGEEPLDVCAVLANPHDNPKQFLDLIACLRSLGGIVPDEEPDECLSSKMVMLSEEFGKKLAVLPTSCLKPAVRYQRELTYWSVHDSQELPGLAVVAGGFVHPADYEELSSYPKQWVDVWRHRDGLVQMPSAFAKYVSIASTRVVERNGKPMTIPELSAVAPNVRKPSRSVAEHLFTGEFSVPRRPAWWYTLPILPRHTGMVFMARVNDTSPHAYLNSITDPVLIDANFSTFSVATDTFSAEALFAFLNSRLVKTLLEITATPMGGGALKVEASHLRVLPIPTFDSESKHQLGQLGQELAKQPKNKDVSLIQLAIEDLVCRTVAAALSLDPTKLIQALEGFSMELQLRRKK
jgi:N-6 DNA Methylase